MAAAAPPAPIHPLDGQNIARARNEYRKYAEVHLALVNRSYASIGRVVVRTMTGSIKGWLAMTAIWGYSQIVALGSATMEYGGTVAKWAKPLHYAIIKPLERISEGLEFFLYRGNLGPWIRNKIERGVQWLVNYISEQLDLTLTEVSIGALRMLFGALGVPDYIIESSFRVMGPKMQAFLLLFLAYTSGIGGPLFWAIGRFILSAWKLAVVVAGFVFDELIIPLLRAIRRVVWDGPSVVEQLERQMNRHPLSHRAFPVIEGGDAVPKTDRDIIATVSWSFSLLGIAWGWLYHRGAPRMRLVLERRRPLPLQLPAGPLPHVADTYSQRIRDDQRINTYHVKEFKMNEAPGQGWRVRPARSIMMRGWGENFEVLNPEAYLVAALERAIVGNPFGAQAITCPQDVAFHPEFARKGIDTARRGWQLHTNTSTWQWSSPLLRLSHRFGFAPHELLEVAAALQLKLRVAEVSDWLQPPTMSGRPYDRMIQSTRLVWWKTGLGLPTPVWSLRRHAHKWSEPNVLLIDQGAERYVVPPHLMNPPQQQDDTKWMAFLLYLIDLSHVLEVAVQVRVPGINPPPHYILEDMARDIENRFKRFLGMPVEPPPLHPPQAAQTARFAQHLFRKVTTAAVNPSLEGLVSWPQLTCRAGGVNTLVFDYSAQQWLPPGKKPQE